MNMISLIWNQMQSDQYRDLYLYSWHNTDPNFNNDELSTVPQNIKTVNDIQFKKVEGDCEHSSGGHKCNRPAFIRCSHCGEKLCIRHFLERVCFHADRLDEPGPSGVQRNVTNQQNFQDVLPQEDDLDDDLDIDLLRNRVLTEQGLRMRSRQIDASFTTEAPRAILTTVAYRTTTPRTTSKPTDSRHVHDELRA